jgi:hypothetical protein
MAHFDLAMEKTGIKGRWEALNPSLQQAEFLTRPHAWQKCEYLVSWFVDR